MPKTNGAEILTMNIHAAVIDALTKADINMSDWEHTEVLYLDWPTKDDPLNQRHILAIKAYIGGNLYGNAVGTANDGLKKQNLINRLIGGLARLLKTHGMKPLGQNDQFNIEMV